MGTRVNRITAPLKGQFVHNAAFFSGRTTRITLILLIEKVLRQRAGHGELSPLDLFYILPKKFFDFLINHDWICKRKELRSGGFLSEGSPQSCS